MTIKQVILDVPDSIQDGLTSNKYICCGGVIRDQSGRIVSHLKEVSLVKEKSQNSIVKKVNEFAYENKSVVILGVLLTISITVAGITYAKRKNKKDKVIEIPAVTEQFNQTFLNYFNAIRSQELTLELVNDAILVIETIEKKQADGKFSITFKDDISNDFINIVKEYTSKLAKTNEYNLEEDQIKNDDDFIFLKNCLNAQKEMFVIN